MFSSRREENKNDQRYRNGEGRVGADVAHWNKHMMVEDLLEWSMMKKIRTPDIMRSGTRR